MDFPRVSDAPCEQYGASHAADDLVAHAAQQDPTDADGAPGTEDDQIGFEPFSSGYDRGGNALVDHGSAPRPHTLCSQLLDGSIHNRAGLSLWLHDRRAL